MDHEIQIEETAGFKLYETEQEYWEEYDRLQQFKRKLIDTRP